MIGKKRQIAGAKIEEIYDPAVGPARGMLRRSLPEGNLRHVRRSPATELTPWIAHYWMIHWDLGQSAPQLVESLPHPNVHLVFEDAKAVVYGVQTQKFSRTLEGRSRVFGVKFRPGGFRPFLDGPVSALADSSAPARRIFGKDLRALEAIAFTDGREDDKVQAANDFFHQRMPKSDSTLELAAHLVECILQEPEIQTVEDLASLESVSKRRLQRIFQEYVGVSPKWVIRRYRLHELIEKANSTSQLDWAQVALDLGYFDQAHLINDFKSMVGFTPVQYQKRVPRES